MRTTQPYACRRCGARAYRPVIARDGSGALRAGNGYRCTGCSLVFANPKAWRDGESLPPPPPGAGPAALPGQADFADFD